MVTVHLKGSVTTDHRLLVNIPDDFPAGEVELTLKAQAVSTEPNEATVKARACLAAAGFLSTTWDNLPSDIPVGDDDDELFELPPGSPTLEQMVADERAER